ncbi:ABC transporter related [Caldicellulosiruptor obsidiansis OB47]|uniref:ABC transporter related n=1 Tax=Caldicellulosiruptor obsidiansis (strain ATCC BAA-2073 / JCM 16842 / OB47) TaxID=608506 RepID=D9THB7_CALOO|nr:ABC transporter ATP-binding protein [Caldicellulosiruptor obsidiansis]ADL41482.1 ABC transporter related [Caldicellulosiruptor obsidiansis OB47]
MIALSVRNLVKRYKNFKLEIPELILESGYIMALLGRNGAGKTTLIRCILDFAKKECGEVFIFQQPFDCDKVDIKQRIGIVFENPVFPTHLKPKELKEIMKGFYKSWDEKLYKNLCDLFEIEQNKSIFQLSKGTVMKLSIALALAHKPDLLILDEPTSGLDPVARNQFVEILQSFVQSEEKAVFYSTHIVSDIENVADFVTIIDKGKIICSTNTEEIQNSFCIVKGSAADVDKLLKSSIIALKKSSMIFEALCKKNCLKDEFRSYFVFEKPSIEKFYVMLVRKDDNDEKVLDIM